MTRSTRHRTARARRSSADRVRARPRLEGLEDRCLMSVTIVEFPVPTSSASVQRITAGPDGNLWFTELHGNSVGMINPATHAIAEFPVPTAGAGPLWITAGPDGNLWFTENGAGKLGMINPTTHAIAEFPVPTGGASLEGITAGPDGNLWFITNGLNLLGNPVTAEIGEINPTTHAITEFALPTTGTTGKHGTSTSPNPYAITAGSDGNLWFTEFGGNKIGEINPATHAITEFPTPTTTSGPWAITAGPDGNLWFTERADDKIGMINPTTHATAEFPVPTANALPVGITSGPDGNLWFAEFSAGEIGEINPATHALTEYPVHYANSAPEGIAVGPDGNVWFTDRGANAIGVVTLNPTSSTHLVVTEQPPASVTAGSAFALTVQAEDSSGNLVSSFNGTVTVGLASNPGGRRSVARSRWRRRAAWPRFPD